MSGLTEISSVTDRVETLDLTPKNDADVSPSQCNELERLNQQVVAARLELKNLRKKFLDLSFKQKKDVENIQQLLEENQGKNIFSGRKAALARVCKDKQMKENRHPGSDFSWKPIGHMESAFLHKSGTPRQGCLVSASRGHISISSELFSNPHHSLLGLEQYSHVWLVFLFHDNGTSCKGFTRAKVSPPRLGGQKLGIFATRSPHRPNSIGLTLAKLDAVVGNSIHVSGVDLLNGTPILDIKPFIPAYDNPENFGCSNNEDDHVTENGVETKKCVESGQYVNDEGRDHYEKNRSTESNLHYEQNVSNESHVQHQNNVEIVDGHSMVTNNTEELFVDRKNVRRDDNVCMEINFDSENNVVIDDNSHSYQNPVIEENVAGGAKSGNCYCAGDTPDCMVADECTKSSRGTIGLESTHDRSCKTAAKTKKSDKIKHVRCPVTVSGKISNLEASSSVIQLPLLDGESASEESMNKFLNELENSTREVINGIAQEVYVQNNAGSDERVNLTNNSNTSTAQTENIIEVLCNNSPVKREKGSSSFQRQTSSQQRRSAAEQERNLRALSDQLGVRTASWLETAQRRSLDVVINPVAEKQLLMFSALADNEKYRLKFIADSAALRSLIVESIASDVRSQYRRTHCQDLLYHYTVDCVRVTAAFLGPDEAEILRVTPAADNP
ncbi:TsaA-like domain [Trinorchestia longiramus]|nr:TsaA-like domain [Trinorchestia longiramus]